MMMQKRLSFSFSFLSSLYVFNESGEQPVNGYGAVTFIIITDGPFGLSFYVACYRHCERRRFYQMKSNAFIEVLELGEALHLVVK